MSHFQAIDCWAQPPTHDFLTHIPEVKRLFDHSHIPIDYFSSNFKPSHLVSLMDKAGTKKFSHSITPYIGIQRLCLSAWQRPGKVVISNEFVYQYLKEYPDRFIGCCSVNLLDPVGAVREIDRCVRQMGFKALRIVPWLWDKPPTCNLYYPLYVKCIELDIPFLTQVGHTGPLCPSDVGRPIPYIDRVALTFPQLKIVGGHIGYPWTDEMIGVAWKHKNVYIDTSAYLPRYYPKQLIHFMRTYGKKKVMFGTNFPHLSLEKCVKQVEEMKLPKDVKEYFLFKNAERVFKIGNYEQLSKM